MGVSFGAGIESFAMATRSKTFSREMLTFFRGLERNNTREWFGGRKGEFEEWVKGPMVEVVGEINERLRGFAGAHVGGGAGAGDLSDLSGYCAVFEG